MGRRQEKGPKLSGSKVNKQRAELRAAALASTIKRYQSAGFTSRQAMADELNRRQIATDRGGGWHVTTVVRMLTRQGLLVSGKGARINNGQAGRRAADAQAKALSPTIRALQLEGLVSPSAIARELNGRGIPTRLSRKWHPGSVKLLLRRLERLEPSSSRRRRR